MQRYRSSPIEFGGALKFKFKNEKGCQTLAFFFKSNVFIRFTEEKETLKERR
ncbi:unnamed protein product [Paramecium octaurelia]|uniref:Uncharacterized protein n=1 Tax=Paramecium octaurelia TaxID=43137 RepID=A0A8S1VM68_PAROT|nr:unnamed protein product [Paramecium octaurelia]